MMRCSHISRTMYTSRTSLVRTILARPTLASPNACDPALFGCLFNRSRPHKDFCSVVTKRIFVRLIGCTSSVARGECKNWPRALLSSLYHAIGQRSVSGRSEVKAKHFSLRGMSNKMTKQARLDRNEPAFW
jgi:hypothetical protein